MTAESTIQLPAELTSVTVGRHFARDAVKQWDLEQLVDDVMLCTSELVANAVRHAGTPLTLSLRLDTELTIEVRDGEPELHKPFAERQIDPTVESGRGLQIVAAVSHDWGIVSDSGGKSVWLTLRLPDQQSDDADVFSLSHRRTTGRSATVTHPMGGSSDERAEEQARVAY